MGLAKRIIPLNKSCRRQASSGTVSGSYLRLIDSCITQLKAQGPSRTCNESKEEEEEEEAVSDGDPLGKLSELSRRFSHVSSVVRQE